MRASTLALILCLGMGLGACGKQQSPDEHTRTGSTPSAALAPSTGQAGPAATVGQKQAAGLIPSQPSKVMRVNEDGSETVEDTTGDNGKHNTLLAAVASTMATATSTAAGPA
jgi:hypothetical protein